jgi:hypothetical protein
MAQNILSRIKDKVVNSIRKLFGNDENEDKIKGLDDIIKEYEGHNVEIARGSKDRDNIGFFQDKFEKLGYLGEEYHKETERGFADGRKTENAFRKFQHDFGLKETGRSDDSTRIAMQVVEAYGKDVGGKIIADLKQSGAITSFNIKKEADRGTHDYKPSGNGIYYDISGGANVGGLKPHVSEALNALAEEYKAKTGDTLRVTSGYRDTHGQAVAMCGNMASKGINWVDIYRDKGQAAEVKKAYRSGGVEAVEHVLEKYADMGQPISSHMSGMKFDLGTRGMEDKALVRKLAAEHGFKLLDEGNHYDLQYTKSATDLPQKKSAGRGGREES